MVDDFGPRLVFTSEGFRYEVHHTQVSHRDYDTLLLAWRQSMDGGPRSQVVLKPMRMSLGEEGRKRAWEEVLLAKHLQHAGISQIHGIASHENVSYVVMEHMRGCYLLTAMDFVLLEGRTLSPAFAVYVAANVADALDHAHGREERGRPLHIIHRAVGPMRIRLGFNGRVKLTNFGAAYSELRERLKTPPGLLRGDPAYCAPEILRAVMKPARIKTDPLLEGAIDGRADVFSLGLVLLEMLAAEYPLDPSDSLGVNPPEGFADRLQAERSTWIGLDVLAYRVLRFGTAEVERLLPAVPASLRSIVRRALHPDPAERYRAAEMRDELRAYLNQLERPFGPEEMANELKSILEAAARIKRLLANPTERTVLPLDEEGVAEP